MSWHHVMQRDDSGSGWLMDDADAAGFVTALRRSCAAHALEVHAYCVLPRHVHLLVRAPQGVRPDAALDGATRSPDGRPPLAVPIVVRRHLVVASRYIHLNPVVAGLVLRPEDWPHSSFGAYLGRPAPRGWPTTDPVLGYFGSMGARHRYRAFVMAGLSPGTRDGRGRPRWGEAFAPGSAAEDAAWRIESGPAPRPRRLVAHHVDLPEVP